MPELPVWIPPTHGPIPQPVTTASGLKRLDVSYAIVLGFRPLELELYLPESAGPAPLIVWIHGGGYAGGSRKEETPWLESSYYREKALNQGFAFASLDYRLGNEARFPAAVNDGHAALRWLAKFAEPLNIDVSRTVLWGGSAGGHLAALLANTIGDAYFEGDLGAEKSHKLKVVGLVDWFGASDLNSIIRPMDGTDLNAPEIARFPPEYFNLGPDRWQDPEWLAKASPVEYVTASSPETFLVHGDVDSMVPLQQSQTFAAKLLACNVKHQLIVVDGGEHAWMGLPQNQVDSVVDQSLVFAKRVCE